MIEINGREFNDLQKFVSRGRYLCGKYLTEKLFVVSIKDVAIKVRVQCMFVDRNPILDDE